MKRYNMANTFYGPKLEQSRTGELVRYEDVKVTAIMNFNLLEQIRDLSRKLINAEKENGELRERIKRLDAEIRYNHNYS